MKTITFHSYKGGTGKSYLSSNLAAIYAEKEKVCLLDMDLTAPTLQILFNVPEKDVWLNDYLDGECGINEVLHHVEGRNLFLGMANPQPEGIKTALGKSKEREMHSLKRLLSLKETLANDGFDRLILDTSPGYQYASINTVAAADMVGIVTTLYRPDILGSKAMIVGVYKILEKPAFMIVNRYHNEKKFEDFKTDVREEFKRPVLGMKCFCDEVEEIGNTVITLENPSHPLSESFRELAQKIDKES
ncbi:MAG: MinD/ParA family protein [Candidatus Aerophobetes bacterium]